MLVLLFLKMHSLHFYLDFFAENNTDVRVEHGKSFHQEVKIIEEHCLGKVSPFNHGSLLLIFVVTLIVVTLVKILK